jgi:signal transduction histidine kinase/ActR/RegA family two-component response regulator
MKTIKNWNEVLRKNYRQVLFVFAAFLVMVLSAYFFVSGILRNRLLTNAEDSLFTAEANVRAAFAESEVSLTNSFYSIRDMIAGGEGPEEIRNYLQRTTVWMLQNKSGLIGIYGIYGYIWGEFIDGRNRDPDPGYIPQTRPWYQLAARIGNASAAYTAPYTDSLTGDIIITAVRNIIDDQGNLYGILAIDLSVEWINEYIKTLRLGNGGYGIIVSQNMVIMSHPDLQLIGMQLQELGGPFMDISRRLRQGQEISAFQYRDTEGQVITFFRRIFNGWYIGLITPTWTYYRDIRYAAIILSILGLLSTCALSYLLLRISAEKMKADEDSVSKSTFLAKMSHEIRTPMNAIIGMSELALREELAPSARNYVDNIKQAGDNLLAIINDILDFSKIESGKLDIVSTEYHIASLINDVISIIRMRIHEKPIIFTTRIDGSLPSVLVGDEIRIRQILLNLLSNAVKYTKEGTVVLSIHRTDKPEGDEKRPLFLAFEVSDTGIGIKKEDMEQLFGTFVQFDAKKNRGIEGTGLGLAISRNLCRLMGGDITVESVYGQGSTFSALLPQGVKDDAPFALVEQPDTKAVLVYDNRIPCAESVIYTVSSLGVDCTGVYTADDFLERLADRTWRYIFTSPALFDEVRKTLEERTAGWETPPVPVLLAEYGQNARPEIQTVFMPIHPAMMASILNNRKNETTRHETEKSGVRFITPDVRILIVDDIEINLDVAEGLLTPYEMRIDRASGGLESVQMVRENPYDLVLMDHMMPGMDGVEAAAAIREWEKPRNTHVPIIALTANAVSGMREMFLEKGFDDYLSKPIEIAKMNEVMVRWLPPEKRIKTGRASKPGD